MKIALMQEPSCNVGKWPFAGMSILGFELNVHKITAYTHIFLFVPYSKEIFF